jgi:hypothetical protein
MRKEIWKEIDGDQLNQEHSSVAIQPYQSCSRKRQFGTSICRASKSVEAKGGIEQELDKRTSLDLDLSMIPRGKTPETSKIERPISLVFLHL